VSAVVLATTLVAVAMASAKVLLLAIALRGTKPSERPEIIRALQAPREGYELQPKNRNSQRRDRRR
jgi:hypothetical protein